VTYVERCADRAAVSLAEPPVVLRSEPLRGQSACREIRYDSAAGPLSFEMTSWDEGWAEFESDLPFATGERFAVVRDVELDAPASQLPLEVAVISTTKNDRGADYTIRVEIPSGFFTPDRVVGPLEGGWAHLTGQHGDGNQPRWAALGEPQLLYEVWLDRGVLQDVVVRCSKSVYVHQTWLVSERRVCIRSSFEHI
jgi:hypothetical protein